MSHQEICVMEEINNNEFTIHEKLYYELLFGINNVIHIIFDDYCVFDERLDFKEHIRNICSKGEVLILDDRIIHTKNYIVWKLEIKRL